MDEHDPSFIVVVRRASVGAGRMTHYALDSQQEDQESFKLKNSQNYASCLNVISNFQFFRSKHNFGPSSGTFWSPLAITLPL